MSKWREVRDDATRRRDVCPNRVSSTWGGVQEVNVANPEVPAEVVSRNVQVVWSSSPDGDDGSSACCSENLDGLKQGMVIKSLH